MAPRGGTWCTANSSDPGPGAPPTLLFLPGGEEVADRVPGTDEDLRLVAPEDRGFVGWDLDVPIDVHRLRMIICRRKQEETRGRAAQERGAGPAAPQPASFWVTLPLAITTEPRPASLSEYVTFTYQGQGGAKEVDSCKHVKVYSRTII